MWPKHHCTEPAQVSAEMCPWYSSAVKFVTRDACSYPSIYFLLPSKSFNVLTSPTP